MDCAHYECHTFIPTNSRMKPMLGFMSTLQDPKLQGRLKEWNLITWSRLTALVEMFWESHVACGRSRPEQRFIYANQAMHQCCTVRSPRPTQQKGKVRPHNLRWHTVSGDALSFFFVLLFCNFLLTLWCPRLCFFQLFGAHIFSRAGQPILSPNWSRKLKMKKFLMLCAIRLVKMVSQPQESWPLRKESLLERRAEGYSQVCKVEAFHFLLCFVFVQHSN